MNVHPRAFVLLSASKGFVHGVIGGECLNAKTQSLYCLATLFELKDNGGVS